MNRIGIFICHCGLNIANMIDINEILLFAQKIPEICLVEDYKYMCSTPGQELIQEKIKKNNLNKIIIAACSPLMHEKTFRNVLKISGINQYLLTVVNFREHIAWVTNNKKDATEKAKIMLNGSIARTKLLYALDSRFIEVNSNVMIIGGGITGIQAALELAEIAGNRKIYLVEKSPSIGGHMAQFDKTFPTLDCSACILTPKMETILQNKNIQLFSYSEIQEVKGFIGNFEVTIKQKARFVDHNKCNSCLACTQKCPGQGVSEFDEKLIKRKAIYIPFPQAVPQKPLIDKKACIFLKKGKGCKICQTVCEQKAINFQENDTFKSLKVGAIIVATGYNLMDTRLLKEYGYSKYANVYHALEVERLLNSAGPTNGELVMKNKKQPTSVAILHCIGSRDKNNYEYCSKVCCMYSLKLAYLIKEKTKADVYQLYIDMRTPGKGYEEFYNRLLEEDVKFIRGKAARVILNKKKENQLDEELIVEVEDTLNGNLLQISVDMVILSPAIKARNNAIILSKILNISIDKYGFFMEKHPKLAPLSTMTDGIFIAGACQGPKDIPDSVAQANGAAAEVLSIITKEKLELEAITANINQSLCCGCQNCVKICPYNAPCFLSKQGFSEINEALCKGCGLCAAGCPTGAIKSHHFNNEQLIAEIEGLMEF